MKTIKTFIGMLWVAGLLAGCQAQEKTKEPEAQPAPAETVVPQPEILAGLTLNNGAKWKADSLTKANVAAITRIIAYSRPVTLEDYHQASDNLQAALTKLIKDCRMKGPDHDALHHWLEPFMATQKQLTESKTPEEAQAIFTSLETQAGVFPQYFE